jgi:hypothetical protein
MMATIPCGQMDISQMALKALRAIASSGNVRRKAPDGMYVSKDDRSTFYSSFEQLGDPTVPIHGSSHILFVCRDWVIYSVLI